MCFFIFTLFAKKASARFTQEVFTPLVATDPVVLRYFLQCETAIQHAFARPAIGRFENILAGISLVQLSEPIKKNGRWKPFR
jgi:hypothetical protein